MKAYLALLLVPLLVVPAFAQSNMQTVPTSEGTLDIAVWTDGEPKIGEITRLVIDFINPNTERTQEHIDYRVTVTKDGSSVFGPIPLTHTSSGLVSNIPVEFPEAGTYDVRIEVEGILFQPIPAEAAELQFAVGAEEPDTTIPPDTTSNDTTIPPYVPPPENGGCLIATAAFGSELAPQVQQLREIRDSTVLQTESGAAFMDAFNGFYYSVSPGVADLERQNPALKEIVKVVITPMLASLSILSYAPIDSEIEMLGYGIGVILLNIGMYVGIPAAAILWLARRRIRGRRLAAV